MKMLDYDPIDKYLSRCLKNWTRQVPLPVNGKENLYFRIGHYVPETPFHIQLLQISLWIIRTIIIIPLDYLLTPLDYSTESDLHSGLYRSRLDLPLAVRAMTNDTLSHGMEIFTYIT
jgi:hypothetical protein